MPKLNNWCKEAQIALIKKDLSRRDVAKAVGSDEGYIRSILNGGIRSMAMVKKISQYLNISDYYD